MPNRIIRESCCTSTNLNQTTLGAECLFWRLMTVADDYGRFEAEARIIKGRCFPIRDAVSVRQAGWWLQELVKTHLIILYEVNDKRYGHFVTWDKYQYVRAKHSKHPAPTSANICSQTTTDANKCSQPLTDSPVVGTTSVGTTVLRNRNTNNTLDQKTGERGEEDLQKTTNDGFDVFWGSYPRRIGKGKCREWWRKHKPTEALQLQMQTAITAAKQTDQWQREGGKYIPHPYTWLNQGRWEDDYTSDASPDGLSPAARHVKELMTHGRRAP